MNIQSKLSVSGDAQLVVELSAEGTSFSPAVIARHNSLCLAVEILRARDIARIDIDGNNITVCPREALDPKEVRPTSEAT